MFAVAGRWSRNADQRAAQQEALQGIVAGVRLRPGFVRGFWSRDVDDPTLSMTYIVFEQREQAEDFMAAVRDNAPAQSAAGVGRDELRILEIEADA